MANQANHSIAVFSRTASGNVPPLRTIAGPATGLCISALAPALSLPVAAGATPTFGFFVSGLGVTIPRDPAVNRVFVRFHRSDGLIVGGTSVAVMTL